MATPSTEERELRLVESVEFKILGVANKEEKLHQLLQKYLAPLILKAASEHGSVRARVIQILAKLKTFIQPPQIALPLSSLLDQYKSTDSALIKQLDLSFMQHSIERIDEDDRRALVPKALQGFSRDEGQHRASVLFNIILRLLLDVRIPPRGSKEDESFRTSIGVAGDKDAKYLAKMIGIVLRLRAPTSTQTWAQANPTLTSEELALLIVDNAESTKIFKRMSELKVKLVALLASGAFTDEEKFLPALYAASSFDGRVASAAEEIVKRSSVSLEDEDLIKRLFHAHSRLPAAYRTRILGMLSKSAVSTTMSDSIMAVVNLDFAPPSGGAGTGDALQPSSALERTKLHKALFQYLSWVGGVGPSKAEFTIGPELIQKMRSYIETQGWPSPQQAGQDDILLRSKAYETIGMLARSADMTVSERLDLVAWLFQSLSEDPINDVVVNIDGALSSLTASVPPSVGAQEPILKAMLLRYMTLPDEPPVARSSRHAVVKWANQCLPLSDIIGRWIDMLAIAGHKNERNDVVEQGHKGLDPWAYMAHGEQNNSMPDWKELSMTLFGTFITPDSMDGPRSIDELKSHPRDASFQNFEGERLSAFPVALRYCKQLMFLAALDDFEMEQDWMQKLGAQTKTDIASREKIRSYLGNRSPDHIVFYLGSCLDGAFREDSSIIEECIRCFVDVASLSPPSAIAPLTHLSQGLLALIKSNNIRIRTLGAEALGILAAHPANQEENVKHLTETLINLSSEDRTPNAAEMNAAEGAILAYGYLSSRSIYYGRPPFTNNQFPLGYVVADKTPPSSIHAALGSLSQLWKAKLVLPGLEGDHSIKKVVESLAKLSKQGNEEAIQALGSLAVGLDEDESGAEAGDEAEHWNRGALGSILTELFALHEIKRVEVHFAVGDAITAAIARWDSDCVKATMDVNSNNTGFQGRYRPRIVSSVLDKLFKDCKATKPSLLKASGIWLFCIVQYCSHLVEVQARLREAQAAFMQLLSSRDELVQETASRGLSLVYERGDSDLKSALVKDLVSAFTGSSTQLKVDEDTELFEPGALPTGDGKSVTSYKDIVNLANEVGDQRLVYKFMSLAANAATWSTRSAFGRFGLSNILSDSEIDPKLYPKLYRYRFDPNTNVQRSMEDIWKALVKDSAAVLDTYFDDILEDLLQSIVGREWRMREASCAAISDLLQGQPFTRYESRYREVWVAALKVLDDVKGSVREAALRLCMGLSNTLVRQLEGGSHRAATIAMMDEAIPFLLSDKGVESSVEDVQAFATITMLKITKQGGKSLRPFIPSIVSQFLGLLSTIEPAQINYYYQRAGEDKRDQIDKLRSQMVSQSPISEAIENCLRFVDTDVMTLLAPRLESTIKTAIGMPTKIGCSRVLTTLFTRHTEDIKPVSARLLRLMEKQTLDRNDEVSQAYARAAAYIMRVVSKDDKQRFCDYFIDTYYKAEDDSRRQKISDVIVAVAKISPDHFTAEETVLLPFAYLGSHDSDEYTSKAFQQVWDQHAGSNRTVVRYVQEIVGLVERCLDTAQWALRHTGAFTVAAMVSDVINASDTSGEISERDLRVMWPVLDKSLLLKTFPGKEKLVDAYPKFVEHGKALWANDAKIAAQMKKIATREAKRNNDEYRVSAFRNLWMFAKVREDIDMLQEIVQIVQPHLDEFKDEDKMDIDSKEDFAVKTARNGLEAVARGYNRPKMQAAWEVASEVLNILEPYLSSTKFSTIKREVWYDCVKDLMIDAARPASSSNSEQPPPGNGGVWMRYLRSLDMDTPENGTEPQRIKRVQAVLSTLDAKEKGAFGAEGASMDELKGLVATALREERAFEVQKAWRDVQERL